MEKTTDKDICGRKMVCPTSWPSREVGDRTVKGSKLILKIVMESKKDTYLSSPDPVYVRHKKKE